MKIRVKKAAVIVLSILLISIGSISTLAANNDDELHLESTTILHSDEVESLKDGEKKAEPMSNGDTYDDVWLQGKIDAGGNIVLDKDVVLSSTVNLPSKSVTIDGGDNKYSIKLAESFEGRHFGGYPSGSNTYTFKNLKIEGHNKTSPGNINENRIVGGGIDVTQGMSSMKFNFEDCLITGCHTTSQGGAINLNNPTVILKNTIFENNSATTSGGAIAKNGGGSITINGGEFRNNSAYSGDGGAIFQVYFTVNIDNTTFEGNFASGVGGAIGCNYSKDSKIINSKDSKFKDNTASQGGAIYSNYINLTDTDFNGNNSTITSGSGGGAILVQSSLNVEGGSFVGNISNSYGGAISPLNNYRALLGFEETIKKINGTKFERNQAGSDGLYWDAMNPKYVKDESQHTRKFDYHDQSAMADLYNERVKNVTGFSKSISGKTEYTNAYNNHDIAYGNPSSHEVLFYNYDETKGIIWAFKNEAPMNFPTYNKEEVPGKKFFGWEILKDEKGVGGWGNTEYWTDKMTLSGPLILKAVFKDSCSITYDSNGGTGSQTDAKSPYFKDETVVVLDQGDMENINHTFVGWNSEADGSGTDYGANSTFVIEKNMTLYAQWEEDIPVKEYEIKYFGNGNTDGSAPIDNHKYDLNEDATVLSKGDLIKRDYTFTGWNTKADGSGKSYKPGDVFKIENSVNLYAQWEYDGDTDLDKDKDKDYNMDFLMWNWHTEKPIETIIHRAYLNGYPDGSIRPQGEITRGEVAAIIARLHADVEEIVYGVETSYSDVNSTDWYAAHISYVSDKGLMEGYEDGTFKPDNKITRAEYATVIARFKDLVEIDTKFEDSKGHWAEGYIGAVNEKGWISGYPDGTFKPAANITREEVVKMTNGMLGRSVKAEGIEDLNINKFTDLEYGTWSYYEMIEASTSHKCLDNDEPFETWIEIL